MGILDGDGDEVKKKIKVVQTRGHQCPICGSIYKGRGSKAKAQSCLDSGDPIPIYQVGEKIVTIGEAYNNAYEILGIHILQSKTRNNNDPYLHVVSYSVKKFAYEQRKTAGNIWRITNELSKIKQSTFLSKNFTRWIEGTEVV
ncbi:hypothetical protein A2V49_04145 [candidate division WWE3 bacterium RBG_19FT_COMBO_34_6]|uniref:Uncharacterized protein n=1 Tax=candidate division WWE3 bacterium RBG_19FT_COMBO_34_6 TaxID=1802612 RepID=A0A1F4ULT3_UNCKA|nr:MAG: hypothetical protein A2V49_04145 [candidate division WWE3 bacterium RBG_19FT_COMBO_34_6]